MRHLLVILFIVLTFSNCRKEDPNYNYYSLAEPEIETVVTPIDSTNIIYKKHIVETQTVILSTFIIVLRQAMFQPELYGLVGNVAETRACPDPVLVDNGGDGFEKELTLTFNEDGSDCDVNGIVYSGDIVVVFEESLGVSDPDDIDVQLTQLNSFVANGFSLTGGTIDLESNGGFGYDYTISGADLVSTNMTTGVSTTIPVGTTGTFSITDEGEDPADPALWFDNPFELSLNDAILTCTGSSTVSTFCAKTTSNVMISPFTSIATNGSTINGCSCPVDGELLIRDAADCTTSPDNCNSSRVDLGGGTCTGNYSFLESVIELISYEGSFTAAEGVATGCTSVDIGVAETTSTPIGHSVQLAGNPGGSWNGPAAETKGSVNTGQTITSGFTTPWINEIHYDNSGGDVGEFVEIAGAEGIDLSEYELVLYNGSSSQLKPYGATESLSGVFTDEDGSGYGFIEFDISGIQNGAPDGMALVRKTSGAEAYVACQ